MLVRHFKFREIFLPIILSWRVTAQMTMTRMTNQTAMRMGETLTEYDNVSDDDDEDNQATSYSSNVVTYQPIFVN